MDPLHPPTAASIRRAQLNIVGKAVRTPLIRLSSEHTPAGLEVRPTAARSSGGGASAAVQMFDLVTYNPEYSYTTTDIPHNAPHVPLRGD